MKECYLHSNALVFGSPLTHVAVGAEVFGVDLYNASDFMKNLFREGAKNWLRNSSLNMGYQIHLDFLHQEAPVLMQYAQQTESCGTHDASTAYRDHILLDLNEQNEKHLLKRLRTRFYSCKKLSGSISLGFNEADRLKHETMLYEEAHRELDSVISSFDNSMGRTGAYMEAMSGEEMIRHLMEFYNPSFAERSLFDALKKFDSNLPVISQCVRDGFKSGERYMPAFGFHYDGYYHNCIILSRPPRNLTPGMIYKLSNLNINDFRIVSTIYPVDTRKKLKQHQKEKNRTDKDSDVESATASALKTRIIADIANGYRLFDWMMVFHVWDKNPVGLASKTQVLKDAIHEWDDADYYVASMPATTRKIFSQIQPGFPFGKYRDHVIQMNDDMVARTVNIDASFHGDRDGNLIYKNHNDGVATVSLFKNGTPLSFTMIGMTGGGKSHLLQDVLMQMMCFLRYIVLIEEGGSLTQFSRSFGSQPKVIHPNSNLCFGPFDTNGLPFSSAFLEDLSSLMTRMFGLFDSEQEKVIIKSYIEEYCIRLYDDIYQEKTKRDSGIRFKYAKEALVTYNYWQVLIQSELDADFLDAWNQIRELRVVNPDAVKLMESQVNEEMTVNFMKMPETKGYIRDVFIATLKPDEYPTLSSFVGSLDFPIGSHDSKRLEFIRTVLNSWCKHRGSKGGLFDGVRNLPKSDRVSHWELANLGDDDSQLKQLVGYMISHFETAEIMRRPRKDPKGFIIDEGKPFLSTPGSDKTLDKCYARFRKYTTVAGFAVQQYDQFSRSPIASTILGNSKVLFLLRQNDIRDIQDICQRFPSIPESAQEAVMTYEMPEQNNYNSSWFTYYQMGSSHPLCGTCKFEKRKTYKNEPELQTA